MYLSNFIFETPDWYCKFLMSCLLNQLTLPYWYIYFSPSSVLKIAFTCICKINDNKGINIGEEVILALTMRLKYKNCRLILNFHCLQGLKGKGNWESTNNWQKNCWDIVSNQIGKLQRTKQSTPLPPPFHSKLGCLLFSTGSSNNSTTLQGGWGRESFIFPFRKTSERPFWAKRLI